MEENFFRPVEEENNPLGAKKKTSMVKSVSLPAIGGKNGGGEKRKTLNKRSRRSLRATRYGNVVEINEDGSKKPLQVSQAEEKERKKALQAKVFGLVHVALKEQPEERTAAQLDLLVNESKLMPAFKHLDNGQLRTLWKYLSYRKFNTGIRLFEQGDDAKNFYVIW